MGYAVRNIRSAGIDSAIITTIPLNLHQLLCTTSETTYYENYIQWDDVEYFRFNTRSSMEAATGDGHIKVYIDNIEKADQVITQGAGTKYNSTLIDCTGITGSKKLKITLASGQTGKQLHVSELTMWGTES